MSYGFEIRDGSNNVVVNESDSQLYVISRHYVPYKSSSFINEPNFDDTEGEWLIKQHYTPVYPTSDFFGIPTNYVAYDSYANQSATTQPLGIVGKNPNIEFTWNNTTKIFSWYAPPMYFGDTWTGFDFDGNSAWFTDQGNFEVIFTRYI